MKKHNGNGPVFINNICYCSNNDTVWYYQSQSHPVPSCLTEAPRHACFRTSCSTTDCEPPRTTHCSFLLEFRENTSVTELGFTNPLVYAIGMPHGRINTKRNGQLNLKLDLFNGSAEGTSHLNSHSRLEQQQLLTFRNKFELQNFIWHIQQQHTMKTSLF